MATELKVKYLKDCLDALEKLKNIRRELKQRLGREGLLDREEVSLAEDLAKISRQIEHLEQEKLAALDPLPDSLAIEAVAPLTAPTKPRNR